MKQFLLLLLFTSITLSQTINVTVSGVTTEKNTPANKLSAHLLFQQWVGNSWDYRNETDADTSGVFSKFLDNITGIDDIKIVSPAKYLLSNNFISSPIAVKATITDFDILGKQLAPSKEINLSIGLNKLDYSIFGGFTNGIYIRRIMIGSNMLTQRLSINKGGISFGVGGISSITYRRNNATLKKVSGINDFNPDKDSLYLMTIATMSGYISDTTISAISKFTPTDIVVNPEMVNVGTYNIPMAVKNFLHEPEPGVEIHIKNGLGIEKTFTSDVDGNLVITLARDFGPAVEMWFKNPNLPDSMYMQFQAIQDSIMYGKRNVYNAKTNGFGFGAILNYIESNLDTLQAKVDAGNSLQYKIMRRFSDTDVTVVYPNYNIIFPDGKVDLTNVNHLEMFLNASAGIMRKFDANVVDTLFVITSNYVHHQQVATTNSPKITSLDSSSRAYWMDEFKNLYNNSLDGWKYLTMVVDTVVNVSSNAIVDRIKDTYGTHNIAEFVFTDDSGPQWLKIFDNSQVYVFCGAWLFSGGTGPNQVVSEFSSALFLMEEHGAGGLYNHGVALVSWNLPGYRGSKFTQSGFKFLGIIENIDQDYPFPFDAYKSR